MFASRRGRWLCLSRCPAGAQPACGCRAPGGRTRHLPPPWDPLQVRRPTQGGVAGAHLGVSGAACDWAWRAGPPRMFRNALPGRVDAKLSCPVEGGLSRGGGWRPGPGRVGDRWSRGPRVGSRRGWGRRPAALGPPSAPQSPPGTVSWRGAAADVSMATAVLGTVVSGGNTG